jgi:MFS family permease
VTPAATTPTPTPSPPTDPARAARHALLLLTGVNLVCYLDRYVVAGVAESLKHSSLRPSDSELGLLMTGFLVVYTLTSPLFGRLGDTRARPRVLALGVALWSLATALGGLAGSIRQLVFARAMVGVGEAAYGTIGPSLLADWFAVDRRGRAFTVFFTAIPVGAALGYALGGILDHAFGWRSAFFVVGVPGLVLAFLVARLRDPPRGQYDPPVPRGASATTDAGLAAALRALVRNRPYRLAVLGYAANTFALGGFAFWAPSFFERIRGLPRTQATATFGAVVVVTGVLGTLGGGWLADRLRRRYDQAYLGMSGISTALAAPLFLLAVRSPHPGVFWPAIIAAELLMFASLGPINTVIASVVSPAIRATAMAVSIFAIHALGDVPAPSLVGMISDRASLETAVLIFPVAALVGGLIWTYAAATPALRPR